MARAGLLAHRKLAYGLLAFSVLANVYLISQHRVTIQTTVNEVSAAQNAKFFDGGKLDIPDKNQVIQATVGTGVCKDTLQWPPMTQTRASLRDWTFKTTTTCPQFSVSKYPRPRQRVALECDGDTAKLVTSWTNSSNDIYSVDFGDKCLGQFIDSCCNEKGSVPNVIHYIWYTDDELKFFHFLSFMSALRFVKPCLFLIHGDYIPRGKYWDYFISNSPNVIYVKRERPTSIFGHKLAFREHSSDIMRIEALKEYGGIYLDFDEVVLRPLESLRNHEYVQGHELPRTLGSQLVMAKKGARFLDHWYDSYKTDYRRTWAWNALWIPEKLSRIYPDLIHVEGFNFTRPDWRHAKQQIFQENYDWSTNYGMHLYARFYNGTIDSGVIRRMNTTLGSVSRYVLFGNKELCNE